MSVRIFYDETSYRIKGWRKIRKILEEVISKENKISGDLNVIITNDKKLHELNVRFLQHDYFTDVITFDYNSGNVVNGEIYISIETVKKNSINYNVSLNNEVMRVVIHGVLHLTGYDDKTESEKALMRKTEDYWLGRLED